MTLNLFLSTHHLAEQIGGRDHRCSLKKWQTTSSPLDGSVHKRTDRPCVHSVWRMIVSLCADTPDTISSPRCSTPSSSVVLGSIVSAWATRAPLSGNCSPWEVSASGGLWTWSCSSLAAWCPAITATGAHTTECGSRVRLRTLLRQILSVNTTGSGGLAPSRCCRCESAMIWSWLVLRGFSSSAVRRRSPGTSWGLQGPPEDSCRAPEKDVD